MQGRWRFSSFPERYYFPVGENRVRIIERTRIVDQPFGGVRISGRNSREYGVETVRCGRDATKGRNADCYCTGNVGLDGRETCKFTPADSSVNGSIEILVARIIVISRDPSM